MSHIDTQFKKGMTPWNKGIKYLAISGEKHHFFGKKRSEEDRIKISEGIKKAFPNGRVSPRKGIKVSAETLAKMKLATKGISKGPFTAEHKANISKSRQVRKAVLGYVNSPETRKKIGISGLGRPAWSKGKKIPERSGENNHNWKGGISSAYDKQRKVVEVRVFKREVKNRDNNECQFPSCDSGCVEMHVHHIRKFSEFPDLRSSVSNGITLCRDCHEHIDKKESQYVNLFNLIIGNLIKK
jgi:5-methylcytosine-specific restriction endonuclease McrA